MKTFLLALSVATLCAGACACAFVAGKSTVTFHDGEGNPIPPAAVQALVKDQFVKVDSAEYSLLNTYFYGKQ